MASGLILLSVLYYLHGHFTIDRLFAMLLLHGLMFPVFVLLLTTERREGHLYGNPKNCYRMIAFYFLGMLVLYYGFSYFPVYCAPVMIPAIFLTGASTPILGLAGSIYLDLMLGMVSEGSYYELAAYIILSMCGVLLTVWYRKKQYRIWVAMIVFALSMTVPALCYYFASCERNLNMLLYGAAGGAVTGIVLWLFFDKIRQQADTELKRSLDELLRLDFPLAQDIRNFSETDYMHACNVSQTAYQCAKLIGADADTTKVAGFYYRLGRLCGEPYVENAVQLAEKNCFPVKVIEILEEYNGLQRLPQTRESAIVHLVDTVITKFELLDKDTLQSQWNHSMVVYQTLDEKSSSGIYDESGLSMNQYLKIREYLVKGVKLT